MNNSPNNFSAASGVGCPPLFQVATLNLYRRNPFRITGLPVDASEREIKRHADKLKLLEELGKAQGANRAAYALEPPPNVEQIREAMQRLREPEERLLDEFFWFWPLEYGKSNDDPAIRAILSGDAQAALTLWQHWESEPEKTAIARHNLAILFHLSALDWTLWQLTSDKKDADRVGSYWSESFKRWELIPMDERIWDVVKSRIRQLDDPRLTTGFARRMCNALPEALDKINAEAAIRFTEIGCTKLAKAHITFMNETNQGLDDVEETTRLVLEPVRKRIQQATSSAEEESREHPELAAKRAEQIIEQCRPLLLLFDLFHDADAYHKTELFDEVAQTVFLCCERFIKKTGNNEAAISSLKECLKFASDSAIRQKISGKISVVETAIRNKKYEGVFKRFVLISESKESAKSRFFRMKTEMLPVLLTITENEGENSEYVIAVSDGLALALQCIALSANNDEKDYQTGVDALKLAQKLAKGMDIRGKILEGLGTIEENLRGSLCFYCKINKAQKDSVNKVAMYGDVIRPLFSGTTHYKHIEISVPRCEHCAELHRKSERVAWGIGGTCAGLGILFGSMTEASEGWFSGAVIGTIVGAILGVMKVIIAPESVTPKHHNYPPIQELLKKGWSYGSGPSR